MVERGRPGDDHMVEQGRSGDDHMVEQGRPGDDHMVERGRPGDDHMVERGRLGDDHMVDQGRSGDDHIIRRIRFACWVTTTIIKHSECLIIIAFPLQQWLRERASMLRYRCIACPVLCWGAIIAKFLC
jgi:hypothetical protein